MIRSGNQGGNPVMSKNGYMQNANYICYSNFGDDLYKKPTHDFGNFDIDKVPKKLIQEKIKLNLMGIDKDIISLHMEQE